MKKASTIRLCETCQHREFDLKIGIVCSITHSKRDTDQGCSDYVEDVKKKKEVDIVKNERVQFKSNNRRSLFVLSALVPATFLFILLILVLNEGEFKVGGVFGIVGYIGLVLLLNDKLAKSKIIIPFLLSFQISYYILFSTVGSSAELEIFSFTIVFWPFIVSKIILAKILMNLPKKK